MKLTYLFHSGFAIESQDCILIVDYFMDPAGRIREILQSAKPIYVLSSHFHEDHFTREILSWKQACPGSRITYILSKDILRRRRAQKEEADVWIAKGGSYRDDHVAISAMGSNDSGVSWIIETGGKRIFHSGDLNNWYARFLTDDYKGGTIMSQEFGQVDPLKEEKLFLGELKDIRKMTDSFDVALFPIDGRIGNGYTRGGRQFIECFKVGLLVPMHFVVSGFESAWRMEDFCREKGVGFWRISEDGESIEI